MEVGDKEDSNIMTLSNAMEKALELTDNDEVNSMSNKKPAAVEIELSEWRLLETTTLQSTLLEMTTLQLMTAETIAAAATTATTGKQRFANATKLKVVGKTNTKAKGRVTKVAKTKVTKSSNEPIARAGSSGTKHMKMMTKEGQWAKTRSITWSDLNSSNEAVVAHEEQQHCKIDDKNKAMTAKSEKTPRVFPVMCMW